MGAGGSAVDGGGRRWVGAAPRGAHELRPPGDVAAAFHLRTIARGASSGDYAVVLVLAVAVLIVLGFVVGAFVNFYVGVAAAYLYGHAFVDASAGEVPPGTGAQPAV